MSINIKVKVDFGGLLEKIKLLQAKGRQSLLQAEEDRSVKSESSKKRENNFKREGKDASGKLKTEDGGEDDQFSIDRKPGANRQSNILPYFFWRIEYNEEKARSDYYFLSGDGTKSYVHSFENKELQFKLQDEATDVASYAIVEGGTSNGDFYFAEESESVDFNSGGPAGLSRATTTRRSEVERDYSVISTERRFILPLGDNTALFVIHSRAEGMTRIANYYYETRKTRSIEGGYLGPIYLDELLDKQLTVETETARILQEEFFCLKIGHNTLKVVEPTEKLKQALNATLPPVVEETGIEDRLLPTCEAVGSSGGCVGYSEDLTDPCTPFQYAGPEPRPPCNVEESGYYITAPVTYLAWENEQDYPSPYYDNDLLSYGLTYQGASLPGHSSPASWFALGSKKNGVLLSSGQHIDENTPFETVGGKTFTSLFKPRSYLGIPEEFKFYYPFSKLDLNIPSGLVLYQYNSQQYMTGPAYVESYLYPNPEAVPEEGEIPIWRRSAIRIRSSKAENPDPEKYWQCSLIYDWNQKGFCKQQAGFYGPFSAVGN